MTCVQGNLMSKSNSRKASVRSIWDYFGAGDGVAGSKG
jgi:hypothetical protein